MELAEQIRSFQDFFQEEYYDEILERVRKGLHFLVIDFPKLARFNPDLAEFLLDHPEDVLKAAEMSLKNFDLQLTEEFHIRVKELPETQRMMIREVRSKHLERFLQMDGIVRQKSDVRPQVTSARFECPSCGNIIPVLQLDQKFKEPSRCGCGRKGKFRLLDKKLVDAQKIVLEEAPEELEGGEQPKRLNVFLKDDLVSPMTEKQTNPGAKVRVTGLVKEVPVLLAQGGQSTRFDLMLEANYVEPLQEDYTQIEISEEEEAKIKELAKDPAAFAKLVESIAPSIYGHEKVKEALVLQLLGGVTKQRDEGGVKSRGDIHILLIGDPGAGKSVLLKRISYVAPKARFVGGKGASGAGLTASVVKDEFLRGWALEAGALVLANKGICCTTEDAEFIKEDGEKMSFKELFTDAKSDLLHPSFRVLGLDMKTLKIAPFSIKQAIRLKNEKSILRLTTRTGRRLELTEENEVLTCADGRFVWKPVGSVRKGAYLAVPRRLPIEGGTSYEQDFAYICGLIASDGHVHLDARRGRVAFYNTDERLVQVFTEKLRKMDITHAIHRTPKGRRSILRSEVIVTKKDCYNVYNSQQAFAKRLIDFGIPSGNKSVRFPLSKKIVGYSEGTIARFLRGVFDGDGSVRLSPAEVTLTTGIERNAHLFQELLLRLGIVSSVKRSTRSWHCEVRGARSCAAFYALVGSEHAQKRKRLERLGLGEVKDRLDVLPNHQTLFASIIAQRRGQLGKARFKYFWNYARTEAAPSRERLAELNEGIEDPYIARYIESDILWDKIVAIEEVEAEYVYDFTMEGTDNFVANSIIMHNCIDELDKMSPEDRSAMHEALEQQSVTISKANIQATLRSETTVLAAANPKFGRFDPYELLAKQIDLPPTLMNRFDLIFPIRDLPQHDKDEKLASFVLKLHQKGGAEAGPLDREFLRKYISYAKQRVKPKITDEALEEIKAYYLKMRGSGGEGEEAIKAIPISARQLEALVRLTEASARVRLAAKAEKKDAKIAIDLVHHCLSAIGLDPATGKFDIDRITTGITAAQRSTIAVVKELIAELEQAVGKVIPMEDIVREAEIKGVKEDDVVETVEKLKRAGDLFSPKQGFISRI